MTQSKNSWAKSIWILLGILCGVLGLGTRLGFSADSPSEALKARAARIYAYDRTRAAHPLAPVLPANRIRALSIAMEFGDRAGAERLVADLESRIR